MAARPPAQCSAFECPACRVWTGESSAPLERIVNADAAEIDVIQRRVVVQICAAPSRRGVLLVACTHDNSSKKHQQQQRSVFLPSDLFRSFAIYRCAHVYHCMHGAFTHYQLTHMSPLHSPPCSPSPFSTSVLVLVDASASLQQCFFFGALQHYARDSSDSSTSDSSSERWSFYRDAEAATELLADLHRVFPDVPLSASARELLSSASERTKPLSGTTTESQQRGRPGALITKRRRTLSATNFYGDRTPLATSSVATPAAAALDTDRSAWQSFYEKLQFRVSHSQLCQLQGSAAVSTVFPRQHEAFEFADQVAAFRQRMRESSGRTDTPAAPDDDETLRLHLPRVFSFEDAREGKRRFLVATLARFWDDYVQRTLATQRHVYEIIREHVPCRLYFDLGAS